MLQSPHLTNVTLFQQAELNFSPGINVFVGENGCGKTHLLKLGFAMASCLYALCRRVAPCSALARMCKPAWVIDTRAVTQPEQVQATGLQLWRVGDGDNQA